jgi:hypothetical protein
LCFSESFKSWLPVITSIASSITAIVAIFILLKSRREEARQNRPFFNIEKDKNFPNNVRLKLNFINMGLNAASNLYAEVTLIKYP